MILYSIFVGRKNSMTSVNEPSGQAQFLHKWQIAGSEGLKKEIVVLAAYFRFNLAKPFYERTDHAHTSIFHAADLS